VASPQPHKSTRFVRIGLRWHGQLDGQSLQRYCSSTADIPRRPAGTHLNIHWQWDGSVIGASVSAVVIATHIMRSTTHWQCTSVRSLVHLPCSQSTVYFDPAGHETRFSLYATYEVGQPSNDRELCGIGLTLHRQQQNFTPTTSIGDEAVPSLDLSYTYTEQCRILVASKQLTLTGHT
jgi:hypothetical protein